MHFRHRRSVVIVLALLAGLAFLGRAFLVRDDRPNAPPVQIASINPPAAEPSQTPVAVEAEAASAGAIAPPSASLATFRGHVLDAVTRQPVREFEVAFHRTQGSGGAEPPGARVYQTNDGRFEWRGVAPGVWLLTVAARGYQRFELEGVLVAGDDAPRELVVPMRAGHALRGRVSDEASGVGVAAANVSYRDALEPLYGPNWRTRPRITTGKDGAFVIDGLPAGRITLMVDARDYAGRELDVLVSEDTQPVEVGLAAGALIAGQLTAADGATAIAGQVGLYSLATQSGGMGKTETGEFRFEHLEPGAYRLVGRAGPARVEQEITLAPNQRLEGVVLALQPSASIRGVVTGLRPEELKQVSISVRRDDGGDDHEFFTNDGVDRNGAFEVQGVAPGRVRVVANHNMRRQISKGIEMPASGDAFVELEFGRGARLSGRVTLGGRPLANTQVTPYAVEDDGSYSYGVRTTAQGEYAVDGLTNGEYRVRVEGYPSRFVHVSGDTVFNIDLPTASLIGRVLEDRGKAPIVGADVELRPVLGARYRWVGRSDHLGRFDLRGVEPGDFMLTVYRSGYDVVRERISYEESSPEPIIRLRRAPGVEIRVRSKGGPPQDVYVLEVLGETKGNAFPIRLDANGVGALPNGFAGGTLSFEAAGYMPTVVRNWGGERLDLQLVRATQGSERSTF